MDALTQKNREYLIADCQQDVVRMQTLKGKLECDLAMKNYSEIIREATEGFLKKVHVCIGKISKFLEKFEIVPDSDLSKIEQDYKREVKLLISHLGNLESIYDHVVIKNN